ncbi:MAG: hypothetical protein KAX49_01670 [Halanaerobiales bacterium]|nr:hypothetical protein [Halanaerobiales bacterium]
MSTVALYTLGNSDLQMVDNEGNIWTRTNNLKKTSKNIWTYIEKDNFKIKVNTMKKEEKYFEEAKILLKSNIEVEIKANENNNGVKIEISEIRFPLLTAFLNKIRELEDGQNPDEIILFATNQESHSNLDTIYLSKIIKRYLSSESKYHIAEIKVAEIHNNPSNYKYMEDFFGSFVASNSELQYKKIYTQVTAGTPAMCFNLALNVIEFKHTYLYIKDLDDKNSSVAVELDYFTRLEYKKNLTLINSALNGLSYEVAREIFNNSSFRQSSDVRWYFDILVKLRNFDYKEAFELSKNLSNSQLYRLLGDLNIKTLWFKRYKIIYDLIEKLDQNNHLLEATVLLSGLHDNLRQYFFEKVSGVSIEKDKSGRFSSFNDYIASQSTLKNKLEKSFKKEEFEPSKPVLGKIIKHFCENSNCPENYSKQLKEFEVLNKRVEIIQDKRNKTPYTHGTIGISKHEYDYEIRDVVIDTGTFIKKYLKIDGIEKENIFDYISSKINRNLQYCFS